MHIITKIAKNLLTRIVVVHLEVVRSALFNCGVTLAQICMVGLILKVKFLTGSHDDDSNWRENLPQRVIYLLAYFGSFLIMH